MQFKMMQNLPILPIISCENGGNGERIEIERKLKFIETRKKKTTRKYVRFGYFRLGFWYFSEFLSQTTRK